MTMEGSRRQPQYEEVLEQVRRMIAELETLDVEAVRPESRLVDDLGMDSLAQIELQMGLEEAYDLTLDEEAASSIATVRQAAETVCAAFRR